MNSMNLSSQLEAILFWKGESISVKELSRILNKTPEEINNALSDLDSSLSNRGLTLIRKDDEVLLGTSSDMSEIIESLTKDELVKDLGKAGLETISIIVYKGPISRGDIDYIRGVNSQFIIRNLLIRGLIEKTNSLNDNRVFLYKPSFELLSYLGIKKIEDLPQYEKIKSEIEVHVASENKSDE